VYHLPYLYSVVSSIRGLFEIAPASSHLCRETEMPTCGVDTVGLVIWPVKIVPDMTYNVFGGTLNLAQSVSVALKLVIIGRSLLWKLNQTQPTTI